MENNYLAVRKPTEIQVIEQLNTKLFTEIPCVEYSMGDSAHYNFEYRIDDTIDVNMFESDRTYDNDEFIDAEFEDNESESNRSYYKVAAVSGTLAGIFSKLKLTEEILEKLQGWKAADWEKYIPLFAKIVGYNKDDYLGAVEYLVERGVTFVDDNLVNHSQVSGHDL